MGVWDGMWQAAQSGIMLVLGAGVLLVAVKFILRIIGQGHMAEFAQILVTITIVSMILVKLFSLLSEVDTAVQQGRPAPQVEKAEGR